MCEYYFFKLDKSIKVSKKDLKDPCEWSQSGVLK